jgi:hypothetical protein
LKIANIPATSSGDKRHSLFPRFSSLYRINYYLDYLMLLSYLCWPPAIAKRLSSGAPHASIASQYFHTSLPLFSFHFLSRRCFAICLRQLFHFDD